MNIALTGCSGGKSALLAELARLGVATSEEPGRLVVRRALAGEGGALPERDLAAFVSACLEIWREQFAAATKVSAPCVFDRTPIDHLAALRKAGLQVPQALDAVVAQANLHPVAIFAPPWPELFAPDAERRHGFDEAVAESDRLRRAYEELGFKFLELPRAPVEVRALWLMRHHAGLAANGPGAAFDAQALR